MRACARACANLDRLAAKHEEVLSTLLQEAHEDLGQKKLELVGLLEADANAHRVDRGLNQDLLLLLPAIPVALELGTSNGDRIQEHFLALARFDLGLVVALDHLRGKVLQAQRSVERSADGVGVGLERLRLQH